MGYIMSSSQIETEKRKCVTLWAGILPGIDFDVNPVSEVFFVPVFHLALVAGEIPLKTLNRGHKIKTIARTH